MAAPSHDGAPADRRLWLRWGLATAGAHVIGAVFWALPASWLAETPGETAGPASAIVMFGLTAIAALAQGGLLGVAQGRVLREVLELDATRWTVATAVGVALGWGAIVVAAPTIGTMAQSTTALFAWSAAGGLVFGALVGGSQSVVLSRARVVVTPWLLGNVSAWAAALLITVMVMQLVGRGWMEIVLGAAAAAVLAGAVLAAITGAALARTPRRADA